MNTTGNMHELIFPNIYMLLNVTYYVHPLTIAIGLVIIGVGWSRFQGPVKQSAVFYQCIKVGLSRLRKFFPKATFPQPCSKKYHHLFVLYLKLKINEF